MVPIWALPQIDMGGEVWPAPTQGAIMDVDEIIGQSLADQSAVGGDKSAPTVGPVTP